MIQFEGNQLVGGLWCSDILAALSQYIDGELDAPAVAQVNVHLERCVNCARFGADVSSMLASLSRQRPELSRERKARLMQVLSAEAERNRPVT